MFDLESAIADWKQSLAARGSLGTDDISELETHLRDSVSTVASMGLNDEEALIIARRRIGPAAALGSEFAKENPQTLWIRRLKWMCLGALLLTLYRFVGGAFITLSIRHFSPIDISMESYPLVFLMADTLCFSSILVLVLLIAMRYAPWLERVSNRLVQYGKFVVLVLFLGVILVALRGLMQLTWWLLFDFSGDSGYAVPSLEMVLQISCMLVPTVLLMFVVCYLHRREQAPEIA